MTVLFGRVKCPKCDGTGVEHIGGRDHTCLTCQGKGSIT